jgi:tRNA 2-thiocytidine biosynthesis protein TtcA
MSFRFASKLERDIVRRAGAAVADYGMIGAGDHILVAISGGKDSLSLLHVLLLLRQRAPIQFRISAGTIRDPAARGSIDWLADHVADAGVPFHLTEVPISTIVQEKLEPNTSPCALCSRIRRGALYTLAPELGCTKIALGHHLDDLIETLLLNLFFSGQLRAMAPYLVSDDRRNIVIRPLCYVREEWLQRYSSERGFPATNCVADGCERGDVHRRQMKALVASLAAKHPGLHGHALRALRNVRPDHLLDPRLLRGMNAPDGVTR